MEAAVSGAVIGATIKVVLQNLLSFPVEDLGLFWNFKKDLKKLKQSVVTIQNFLDDAEMKQVTDKPVQCWLHKLEALAYDADYVLDELNYQVLRNKVETDNKMMTKKVSSFFSAANPIAFRHKMAKKINHIKKELKSINQEASELGLQMRFVGVDARGPRSEASTYYESDSFTADRIFVGRENDARKIVEIVTSSSIHEKVISILAITGMGGLGKTTLARKVYNDHSIVSHFEHRIWVHVSDNFVPETVFKSVVATLAGENVDGSREIVLRKLQEKFENKRYLLVLDNVWNEDIEKWDNFIASFEGISPAKGNVIIVTTRSGNVASIVITLGVLELKGLFDEDCWSIIKAKAFGESVPSEFEMNGRNIAKRCKGLPLAAKVVGGLLRGKSKDEWISVENKWLLDFGGDENSVAKILKLSFDNLHSPSLKKCFAYCSVFPKGFGMLKGVLIETWMAEGFLQPESERDMEFVGLKAFQQLIQSSLLQIWEKDQYGNVITCGMHDLVHDLASSILNPRILDNSYQVRHIYKSFTYNSPPIAKEQAQCLHGLFFHSKVPHIIVLSNLKRLHVLILVGKTIEELPNEIGKLISLRCLDISHTTIKCLPDSTGDLYHLQTLRATYTLRKLPDTLQYLISLRHLYISTYIKLPAHIGQLKSLRTLPFFQVGEDEGCGIMELGSLKNLRGRVEIYNLEKVRDKEDAKSAHLLHKKNIVRLKLVWIESGEGERTNDENVLEGLQPHPNLKMLEIHGFKGRSFPLWTLRMSIRQDLDDRWVRLDNLLEVKLSGCKECEEIPMLGHLPHLILLFLHHLTNVKSLGSSFYGIKENEVHKEKLVLFPSLVKLELIGMANLTEWAEVKCDVASAFRRLKDLKIANCRKLISAPSHFSCLKELVIDNMESGLALANICGSKLTSLTKLIIYNVDGLVCLPDGLFHNNRDLLELKISHCKNLSHLVPCLGGGGPSLRRLVINECGNFVGFPEESSMWCCPSGGQGFTSLRLLQFCTCNRLTNLPCELLEACAPSLEQLALRRTQSLTNMPQLMSILHKMPRLRSFLIQPVPKLGDMAAEIASLRSLEEFGVDGSSELDYVYFNESLDRISPAFQSLRMLFLIGMEGWDALPDQLQHLTTIRKLCLYEFGVQFLPEWLGNLSSLTVLFIGGCRKLRRLPSKKAIQKLTILKINDCPVLIKDGSEWSKISHIPNITVDNRPISGP